MVSALTAICLFMASCSWAGLDRNDARIRAQADVVPWKAFDECSAMMERARSGATRFADAKAVDIVGLILKEKAVAKMEPPPLMDCYDLIVVGEDYSNYSIRAVSKCGGRSFVYDPRWDVTRLVFSSVDEKTKLARCILRYYQGGMDASAVRMLFLAIPNPGGLAVPDVGADQVELSEYLGDCMTVPGMAEGVIALILTNPTSLVRRNAMKSILSIMPELPVGVKQRLATQVRTRMLQIPAAGATVDESTADERRLLMSLLAMSESSDRVSLKSGSVTNVVRRERAFQAGSQQSPQSDPASNAAAGR